MKSLIVAGVAAVALTMAGGGVGYAQSSEPAGAESSQPATASSDTATTAVSSPTVNAKKYDWTFSGEFVDPGTGRSYYRAYANDAQAGFLGRVVYRDGEGEWHALPDRYLYAYWDRMSSRAMILDSQDLLGIQRLFYNPSTDTVVRRVVFDRADGQAFGLLQLKSAAELRAANGDAQATLHSLLLVKNGSSGEIRLLGESEHSFKTWRLDDGSLLVERFSEEAKQNEIVKIDPSSGKEVRLKLASAYTFNEASQGLLIAYNEPTRKQWIYNVKDGTVHPASSREIDAFYDGSSSASAPTPASPPIKPEVNPPSDLQPQLLPVTSTTDTFTNEAEIAVNGTTVKLPFAFRSGGTTFVPVRSVMDASLCTVEQTKTAEGLVFTLRGPSGSATLRSDEIKLLGFRLYVTTDQLKSVGLATERLAWTQPD